MLGVVIWFFCGVGLVDVSFGGVVIVVVLILDFLVVCCGAASLRVFASGAVVLMWFFGCVLCV